MSKARIDAPGSVRSGEELDSEALREFLAPRLDHPIEMLTAQQFPSGFSNLTYLIAAGNREYVLRRPPFGAKARTAHDMNREFRILSALAPRCEWVPGPVLYCDDESVIGSQFYLMERVRGVILRPRMSAVQTPPQPEMKAASSAFVDTLVELHGVDLDAAGMSGFGKPEGYVTRQVEGWANRYGRARTDDVAEMESIPKWLMAHLPGPADPTLIHNDFKYDNLVYDPGDFSLVRAVLDWELATVGDPLMDLGSTLGYWTDPDDPPDMVDLRLSPTTLPGNPRRVDVAEQYAAASGRDLDEVVFYYAFGLFKIAVIVQQIYYRYQRGDTRDPRFASLIHAVRACARMAWQSIQVGRIGRLFQE